MEYNVGVLGCSLRGLSQSQWGSDPAPATSRHDVLLYGLGK